MPTFSSTPLERLQSLLGLFVFVLLAFLIGITLAGFWGAIIAIPAAVFVLEYIGDKERRRLVPVMNNQ